MTTDHNAANNLEISGRKTLPVEVQQAVLNLIAWVARYHLTDHGYDVSADLRLVLDQFQIVIKGPIAPNPPIPEHNEVNK